MTSLLLAAVLFAAGPVAAQDSHGRSRVPPSSSGGGSSGGGGGGERQAVPRGSSPPSPPPSTSGPTSGAERRGVERTGPTPQANGRNGYYGGAYYYPRALYPRALYPYGYGAFGLGYFYYDPFYFGGLGYPGYGPAYGGYYPYPGYSDDFDNGRVRLKVKPRDAEVYVNGYYAGHVSDFDGLFEGLKLQEGNYQISISAPGYEPLDFDVHVVADHKTTYEGELLKARP